MAFNKQSVIDIVTIVVASILTIALLIRLRRDRTPVFYIWLIGTLALLLSSVYALAAQDYSVARVLQLLALALYILGLTSFLHLRTFLLKQEMGAKAARVCRATCVVIFLVFGAGTILQLVFLPILTVVIALTDFTSEAIFVIVLCIMLLSMIWQALVLLWIALMKPLIPLTAASTWRHWRWLAVVSWLQMFQVGCYILSYWFPVEALLAAALLLLVWMSLALFLPIITTPKGTLSPSSHAISKVDSIPSSI